VVRWVLVNILRMEDPTWRPRLQVLQVALLFMKKRILYVITKSNFGGAQKYVYDLATGIAPDDFDVAVAMGGEGILADKLRKARVRTITIPSLARDINPVKDLTSFFALLRVFRAERPDVIHINSAKVGGLGALAGRLSCLSLKLKTCHLSPVIIFTAHGWAFNEDRSVLSKTIIKLLSWVTVVLSHKTIAVSQAVKDDTTHWPFIKNKVFTIPIGVSDIPFLSRADARARISAITNIPLPENMFLVGTIAEFHQNKGLQYAIQALATIIPKNPEIYYIILGNGEEENSLRALIAEHKLENHVSLLIMQKDAAQFLPAFDCFLLSSIKEGLPYVILEAGLAKLPVIATSVGGIPEVIEDGKSGILVHPRNPKELAHALMHLFGSPEKRGEFAVVLHEKVSRDFSLDSLRAKTYPLYKK